MVAMATTVAEHWRATRPQNLNYIIEYFKNAKIYKLQNRHIS